MSLPPSKNRHHCWEISSRSFSLLTKNTVRKSVAGGCLGGWRLLGILNFFLAGLAKMG